MALAKVRYAEYFLVFLTFLIIPGFYFVEVYVILPELNEKWSFWYNFHYVMSIFLLHNVAGNFGLGIQGPGNTRENVLPTPKANWKFCPTCDRMSPPRSWHCETCRYCVFKRDHHCHFFGCCVGYFNFRYFYMFVMHVTISAIYALVVNLVFFYRFVDMGKFSWLSLFNFLFPMAALLTDLSGDNAYVLLLGVNIVILIFTGVLSIYHGMCLVKGKTPGESKHISSESYDHGLKMNFADAFGRRWYVAWISPFLSSPLLGDGTHWITATEFKVK